MNIYNNIFSGAVIKFLGLPVFLSFLKMFTNVMQNHYDVFANLITHSGQAASLEHFLNTQVGINYDMMSRAADITAGLIIYIDEGIQVTSTLIYNTYEAAPDTLIYNNGEGVQGHYLYNGYEFNGSDYVVMVPSILSPMSEKIKAWVEIYRLVDKNYIIQYY